MTWRDLIMVSIGAAVGPVLWLSAALAFGAVLHGSWTSLDDVCSHPKDGRTMRPGLVHQVPGDRAWPLLRCPICGSRWARSYMRGIPGAGWLLARVWSRPPSYSDEEIDRRWDAYEQAHRP